MNKEIRKLLDDWDVLSYGFTNSERDGFVKELTDLFEQMIENKDKTMDLQDLFHQQE